MFITGTENADNISNTLDGATISALGGNDTIENYGANVLISGGEDRDLIYVGDNNVSINGGTGNDSISGGGVGKVYIYKSGDGNDYISDFGYLDTLIIEDAEFTIEKIDVNLIVTVGQNRITLVGAANLPDVNIVSSSEGIVPVYIVSNAEENISINGENTSNSIINTAENVTITSGNDKDYISNNNSQVTIDALGGNDSISNSGSYDIIINGGTGADSIDNTGSYLIIDGGEDSDYINNSSGSYVTIAGSGGNDYIYSTGENSSINGDEGNDTINNSGSYALISGGEGDDSLYNLSSNVTINGDGGNDSIGNEWGNNVSIDSGAGDDYIYSGGSNILFKYSEGDGKDTIEGFNATSTLQIGGGTGTYSKETLDNDIIVTVGESSITLQGAASLESVNIDGEEIVPINPLDIIGTEDADNITNTLDGATISALGGKDFIFNSGDNVLFLYNEGDDNDLIQGFNSTSTLQIGGGTDTYSKETLDNDIIVTVGEGSIILQGAASLESVNIDGEEIVPINPLDIIGTEDADNITNTLDGATISALGGKDFIFNSGDNVLFLYNEGDGNDLISGFNSTSTLQIGGGTDTYSKETLDNDIIVTVGESSITLQGAASLESVNIDGEEIVPINLLDIIGTDDKDNIKNTLDGATISALGGKDIIYNSGDNVLIDGGEGADSIKNYGTEILIYSGEGNDSISNYSDNVTISTGEGKDIIYNKGDYATINSGEGNDSISNKYSSNVTIEAGEGLDNISNSYSSNVTINGGESNDTISNKYSSDIIIEAGEGSDNISNSYSSNVTINGGEGDDTIRLSNASENIIIYNPGDGNDFISGFNETSTLQIGDGQNTYYKTKRGSDIVVTVDDGKITLQGAATLSAINISGKEISNVKWSLEDSVVIFSTLDDEILATITGIKSFDGLSLNDSIVTASTKSLGTDKITISDGYTLALADDVKKSSTIAANYYDSSTMTYSTKGTTTGYNLSSDGKSISYTSGTSKEFQFSGIASGATASNFYISGKTITIGKAAVQTNGTAVKLLNQSGYTLKLGKGMTAPTDNAATLKSGVYTFGGKSAGYVLDTTANTIKYSAATSATLELSGVKSALTAPSNGVATLKLANFNNNLSVTSNAGKYKFSIASGTYTGKTFTGSSGADTIANAGSSLIINSGAGNDSIKSSGTNSTINAGAGNDLIYGSKGNDSLRGYTGEDKIFGENGNDKILGDAGKDTIDGGAGNDSIYGGKDNDSIFGGAGADSLSGEAGNDTLWGGAGNDTLFGGAGNDIFIYKPNEGTDHITDYANGDILKILNTDGTNGTYTKAAFASNKLTLTISGGGSVIFDNVSAGSKININGTTKTISGNTLK